MTDQLSIGLAQVNLAVGDLASNSDCLLEARRILPTADVILYPELALVGYPPEDLVLKSAFVDACAASLKNLAAATGDGGPAMLVGTVWRHEDKLHNAIALLDGGDIVTYRAKHELPNYGVFDEKRVFDPGPLPGAIPFRNVRLGVPICEDIWHPDVCECLAETGAELLLVPNGSPFEVGKDDKRLQLVLQRIKETKLPLAYLNRIGGQDELVFDGASFVVNADAHLALQMADWEQHHLLTHWQRTTSGWGCAKGAVEILDDDLAGIYHAMMLGLRDYVRRNRFPGVVLGLSGGIDSALSAVVAADALGPDKVWCVMMPSPYTSPQSLEDAAHCAQLLGTRLDTISIVPAIEAYGAMLAPQFAERGADITEENLQSRARGMTLMALSNKFGPMVLTTGNKSEMSTGYATLYGDMCGGYSVLKDVYKTTVFALSRWRNSNYPATALGPRGAVMPERVIDKPPSAELRENQKDEDSLPPYPLLDAILDGLVEREQSVAALVAEGFDGAVVRRVEHLLYVSEYKRRQAPPGVKISQRNFGRDRRYPITHGFRTAT